MAFKVAFAFALLLVAVSAFEQELSCTLAGGLCMLEKDCPHDITPGFAGMCPQQKADGAVCCDRPVPDRCMNGAGECSKNCPPTISHLSDECPAGQNCCVWL